jgi:hypothetical protein
MNLLNYVENDDERDTLLGVFNPECPNVDPYDEDLRQTTEILTRIGTQMRPKHRLICDNFVKGLTAKQICEKLRTTRPTIKNALESDIGQRYIATLQSMKVLQNGPSEQSRIAMLWRIAVKNEDVNPRVAIQAIETMNKQDGTYASLQLKDVDAGPGQIVIRNFTVNVNAPEDHIPAPTDPSPEGGTVIEGEFTPINIEKD